MPRARIALALALLALLAPVAALAQRTLADSLPTGRVLDGIVSRADAGQRYAVYLPSTYSRARRWPLLVLMDPRGRAPIPLERFRPIAERLGYLVASSYDTRSDGAENPNPRAVDAIIEDAERLLSLDARRVYLVGFSGTARAAWMMSEPLAGTVAGIVGVGAGLPASAEWLQSHVHGIDGRAPFVVFTAAGTFDPNYEEVRALGPALAGVGIPHRWESFEGPHAWPPEIVCAHAVEWLELQAMRRGLADPRVAWMDSIASARLAEARALERARALAAAHHAYAALVADLGGLAGDSSIVHQARERLAALDADRDARRDLAREDQRAERDQSLARAMFQVLASIRGSAEPPALDDALRRLDIDGLKKRAARAPSTPDDSADAAIARRALARIVMFTGFYEPRDYETKRMPAHAELMRSVARVVEGKGR